MQSAWRGVSGHGLQSALPPKSSKRAFPQVYSPNNYTLPIRSLPALIIRLLCGLIGGITELWSNLFCLKMRIGQKPSPQEASVEGGGRRRCQRILMLVT